MVVPTPREIGLAKRYATEYNSAYRQKKRSMGICVEKLAEEKPKHIGLYYEDSSWTWKVVNEECNKFSNYYRNLGLNLRKEAYNIEVVKDPLFYWDPHIKKYMELTTSAYQKIMEGKMRY